MDQNQGTAKSLNEMCNRFLDFLEKNPNSTREEKLNALKGSIKDYFGNRLASVQLRLLDEASESIQKTIAQEFRRICDISDDSNHDFMREKSNCGE